jgi:hypothetical protein
MAVSTKRDRARAEKLIAVLIALSFPVMSTVAEIIDAVKQLNDDEKDEFLEKLRQIEFENAWDRKIAADAKAGKLDFLVRKVDEAIRGETLRDWPGETKP